MKKFFPGRLYEGYQLFQKFKDGLATEEDFKKMILPRHALHATGLEFLQLNLNPKSFLAPLPKDLEDFVTQYMHIDQTLLHQKLHMKIKEWQHLLKTEVPL